MNTYRSLFLFMLLASAQVVPVYADEAKKQEQEKTYWQKFKSYARSPKVIFAACVATLTIAYVLNRPTVRQPEEFCNLCNLSDIKTKSTHACPNGHGFCSQCITQMSTTAVSDYYGARVRCSICKDPNLSPIKF